MKLITLSKALQEERPLQKDKKDETEEWIDINMFKNE